MNLNSDYLEFYFYIYHLLLQSKTEIHEKKVDVKMKTRLSNPKADIPKVDYPPIESKRHKSNSTRNTRKTTNKQQIKRENNKRKR